VTVASLSAGTDVLRTSLWP